MGLWDAVSDVGKGVGRFAASPFLSAWRLGQTGYKAANFFVDVAQEAVYDHGLSFIPAGKEIGVGPEWLRLKISDDEYEDGIWGAVYGSVNDNILGEGGAVAKLIGPRGAVGELIRGVPEWFLRDQVRGPVQGGAKGIDVAYRYAVQRTLGTALTVASVADARGGRYDFMGDDWGVLLDTEVWADAWDITQKRTIGQAVAHALMTADIEDPEQVAATELRPEFNILSGALDLKAVFRLDPTRTLTPVVRGARLKYGTKGAMLHAQPQTRGRWDPRGEGGMFGPEGVVGSRHKISPEEFVETPRVQEVLDIVDEHAADLDFSRQHDLGFNGPMPPPLTMAETLRRMPDERTGVLSPDAVKVQTLAGRMMKDRRLSRLRGWTPELAQALAIAPDTVTRKFVLRLAMGDRVAREAVEQAMRVWVESQTSTNSALRTIKGLQDDLAAGTDATTIAGLEAGLNGAAQQAIRELIELNPANAGSLFQVAYAMGHNQMGALARFADDTLRADIPIDVLDAAGDATLLTAANDFVLAGLFSESLGVNRTLFSTLHEAPAIAVRRSLGYNVMNVIEPIPFAGPAARRIIEVTREVVPDHIMDFRNVDQAAHNWRAMIREAAGAENGQLLPLAMKKLKIEGDADTLIGMWQTKTLSQRKQFFYDVRDAMADAYVQNFSSKIDPKLLQRAKEFAEDTGLPEERYINFLLFNIKGRVSDAEKMLRAKGATSREFATGKGVVIDGQSAMGTSYRRNVPIMPAHLAESAVIPRYSYLKNLEPKSALTNGARFVNGYLDLAMSQWKKSVLLRPGWPLRVLTDEELRAISAVGLESQLVGFKQGLLDYRTELTRRRGIDVTTPSIEKLVARLQDDIDQGIVELPGGGTNASALPADELFDVLGPEVINEVFEATTKELLEANNRARRIGLGVGGAFMGGPAGLLATAGLYGRVSRKTVQTAAVREAAEYFGFQIREVSVRQLEGIIDDIKVSVSEGRLSPEAAATEITNLRHATDLLEMRAISVDEAMDLLHPRMSADYEQLLTNFDRTGLLMHDAGYQGFMLGPHGAKNVFGNDPFEIMMSRNAASSDGGRRALVQSAGDQRAFALAQEYGSPQAYQVFHFRNPDQAGPFAARWDDTVNKQWTPTGGVGVDEWVGTFQTYIKNVWRLTDDEMVAWLEAQRGTEFARAFPWHYLDDAGEASTANLRRWVEATRTEMDSILPRLDDGNWGSDFIPTPRAVEAFNVLRERASRGERLSWNKDILPELEQIRVETADSLFGDELVNVHEVIERINGGMGTAEVPNNFGQIVSHSGIGQDLATGHIGNRFMGWVDETMYKMGTASVNHLSRNPLWKALYETHGARRVQPFRNADGSYSLTRKQHADAMQAAKREALKDMRELLYELGKRTRFQEIVGNLSPFFGAYQEVISKWAGIAVRNPVYVARGTRYYQMANDEDNRIHLDFSDWAENDVVGKAMGKGIPGMGWVQPLLENQVVTMNPGSIMIWNASPGLNPGANFTLGELVIRKPEIGEMIQFLQPYGSSEATTAWRRAIENAEPTILRRLPVEGSTNYDKMVGLVTQDLMGEYIRQGIFVTEENLSSIGYEFTKEVESRVKQIMAVHAVAGAALPVSISVTSPDYKIMEGYRKVQAAKGFEQAVIWLLNNHPEYWHITRRRTQLREGVAAVTREGSRRKEQHENYANRNPLVGDFVLGEIGAEDSTSTFSYFAYSAAIAQGNLERPDALETLKTTATSVGWVEYRARMEPIDAELLRKFEAGETRSLSLNAKGNETERAERNAIINDLKRKYPYWYNAYNSSGGQEVIRGVLVSFTEMVNDHWDEFDYRPELEYIREYLDVRWKIQQELKSRPNTSLRNSDNIDLYNDWKEYHIKWGQNPTFNAVLLRYFNNDFISPDSWIDTAPKGLG